MRKLFISALMILGIVGATSSCVRNDKTNEGTVVVDSLAVDSLAVADSLKTDSARGKSVQ